MVRDYPRLSAIATACLERCRSAILEIMVIGPLRIERRSTGCETTHNHVGDDGARLGEVEGGEGRVHGGLPQILPSPQEFRIDRADLVERCAQLAKIVDQSGNLQMSVVGHVVSSRSPAGLADGQIPLRAVSRSVDAVAVRSTAALVSLDQCAAQHLFDRWQIAHKSATASAQGRCGKVLDHRICPIESDGNSSVNSNFGRVETSNQVGKRDQSEGVDDQRCSVGANLLVRWRPIGPLPWHRDGTEIGMAKAQRLDTRDTSALQDDKPLTTQRMKWVDDLSQSQRLVGKECSSTSVSQPSLIV